MDLVWLGFILYLIIVFTIGIVAFKKNKTQEDFLLAGRNLGPWVAAISERASGESAWMLLGLPGAAFAVAYGEVWTAVGSVTGIIFYWIFVARKLREETEKYKALTVTEFLSSRFGDENNAIRWIASIIIIFFYTAYVAAQLSGAGKTLDITFGIPNTWGIILATVVVIFYTLCGGFLAVAWTDFFQGMIMVFTLVVLPVTGLFQLGGFEKISIEVAKLGPKGTLFGGKTGLNAILQALSGMSWGLGYMAMPHLLTRFMAFKNPDDIAKGRIIAFCWAIPAFTGAVMIGLVGLGIKGANFALKDADMLMPLLAKELLPAWFAGILISGAIAAMMSTADSQLLVVTSAVGEDIYHKALGKEASEKQQVFISRIVVLFVGVMGFILAITSKELIMDMVSYAWGGLGAAFGPVILLTLYWERVSRAGVLAGMLTGSIGTVIWKNIKTINDVIPERLAVFVIALFAVIIVSLLTGNEEQPGEKLENGKNN
ncbi:sodium/proline symporter [Candidatus Riflebacteria bacterium]